MNNGHFWLKPYQPRFVAQTLSETIDWGMKAIGADVEWGHNRGAGVKVAVLDTGVAADHPDLAGAIVSYDDVTGCGLQVVDGHGTHCAGIVGARKNDMGVIGVAPECELVIVKVLADTGWGDFEWIAQGIQIAVSRGANIINLSLGSNVEPPQVVHDAIIAARQAGVLIFAAAGNDGEGLAPSADAVDYPARWPEVIAVGAVGQNLAHAPYSSPGPAVGIAAPGTDIYSTWPPNQYSVLSGTSMATPFVCGAAALLWAEAKASGIAGCIADYVLTKLDSTTRKLGGSVGRDGLFGYGLLQVTNEVPAP